MNSELVGDTVLDRAMLLDNCVDGEVTRFNNLIGKDYDEFILIADVIKSNISVLSQQVSVNYIQDDMMKVKIPTTTSDIATIHLSDPRIMSAELSQNTLTLNIAIKKEW